MTTSNVLSEMEAWREQFPRLQARINVELEFFQKALSTPSTAQDEVDLWRRWNPGYVYKGNSIIKRS